MSSNSYILRWSSKNKIFIKNKNFYYCVQIGIYSVQLLAIDTYLEVVKKMYSLLQLLGV